jgi:hypothetical protein
MKFYRQSRTFNRIVFGVFRFRIPKSNGRNELVSNVLESFPKQQDVVTRYFRIWSRQIIMIWELFKLVSGRKDKIDDRAVFFEAFEGVRPNVVRKMG